MPDLDFDELRRDLRQQIEVPGYGGVRSRARTIRRRRTWSAALAGVACLAVFTTGTVLLGGRGDPRADEVAATTDAMPDGAVWRGGPITLLGLNGQVLDVPGEVRDVQFADADHGYALSTRCDGGAGQPCDLALAASEDGGRTWRAWDPPVAQVAPGRVPQLITVDATGIVLDGESTWFGRYGRGGWQRVDTAGEAAAEVVADGRLGLAGAPNATATGDGCVARPLRVWRGDGRLASLAEQPDLDVCWVAPAPAGDGAWWVGGTAGGAPAVAVSRDSGLTWQVSVLAGPSGSWAQTSVLGADVFATVVSVRGGLPYPETRAIHGVYRSTARGPFTAYGQRIGTVIGDVVPLLDGRLLTAGPNWYLTARPGADLAPVSNSLPWVYRIQATPGGWIALDLFDNGWTAVSRNGKDWQKINVR